MGKGVWPGGRKSGRRGVGVMEAGGREAGTGILYATIERVSHRCI